MKLTLPRSDLKTAVAGFGKVINGRSSLPVLGCVRFESGKQGAVAAATDMDQSLTYAFAQARQEGAGVFVLSLSNLKELTKGGNTDAVTFETNDGLNLAITNPVGGHDLRQRMTGIDPEEFPPLPEAPETRPAEGFIENYQRLVPFASTDTTRHVLNSVYVDTEGRGKCPMTMVATDGRRLSMQNSLVLPLSESIIVPITKYLCWPTLETSTALGLRTGIINDKPRVLGLCVRGHNWCYDVKLIEGTYPNYRQVVPTGNTAEHRIVFTDKDVATLKQVLPTFPGVNLGESSIRIRPGKDGKLLIDGRDASDAQETTMTLSGGEHYSGNPPAVYLNALFLLDALHAGFREFAIEGADTPLLARDGRGGTHVLMPHRVGARYASPEADPEAEAQPEAQSETEAVAEPEPEPEASTPGTEPSETLHNQPPIPDETPSAQSQPPKKGATRTMKQDPTPKTNTNGNGNGNGNGAGEAQAALETVRAMVDTAKTQLREASRALSDVTEAVKLAMREHKTQSGDLDKARATLQKLQAISL